ncbi:hypothetical protein JYU34_014315 [Plutella xylostella]|uniref:Uncharacterized protein n=1 Tax=Plutella xylostella TaxID=51655 RepID=A0ABQ7Q806_PLUXY|nr:hypothetical protein JYU34_014315 [Plutella xylostella]
MANLIDLSLARGIETAYRLANRSTSSSKDMTESTDTPAAAAPEKTPTENGATDSPPEETPDKAAADDKETAPPPKEMRAVVLTGFGGLKTVKILKKPEPTVAEGEVLIRVKAWPRQDGFAASLTLLIHICRSEMHPTNPKICTHAPRAPAAPPGSTLRRPCLRLSAEYIKLNTIVHRTSQAITQVAPRTQHGWSLEINVILSYEAAWTEFVRK